MQTKDNQYKSIVSSLTMQIFLILSLTGFLFALYRVLIIYNYTMMTICIIATLIYIYIIADTTVKAIKNIIFLVFFYINFEKFINKKD